MPRNELEDLFKNYEKLPKAKLQAVLANDMTAILPALDEILGRGKGLDFFLHLIIDVMSIDRKLTPEEYSVCEPFLQAAFGDTVTFDKVKALVDARSEKNIRDLEASIDSFADAIGEIDPNLKLRIAGICMVVCAGDGEISAPEKSLIYRILL